MSVELDVLPSAVPVAVPGLVVGTRYVIQHQGTEAFFAEAAMVAPEASDPAVSIAADVRVHPVVELEAGESLFVWGDPKGRVIVNEAI